MSSPNRFEVLGIEVESTADITEPTDLLENGELIVDLSMDIVKETTMIPHVAQIDKELEQYEAEKAMFLDVQSDESDDDIRQGDSIEPTFFNDHIVNEKKVAPVVKSFKDKTDAISTNFGAQTTKGKSVVATAMTQKKPTVRSVPLGNNNGRGRPKWRSS
ncbi:hypothetical protein FRX31_018775 [Thalictrum thalictroides]|uniref:Uncharacterized protein n=1 Tax=Thalictrum thalictroides TaxID=46969 RepID=A0A7J6W529_THATH|nr:hypothetical protein FRX31_018775 [Thalictrum thalictroides]